MVGIEATGSQPVQRPSQLEQHKVRVYFVKEKQIKEGQGGRVSAD